MKILTFFAEALIKADEVGLSGSQVKDSNTALSSIMDTVYYVAGVVAVVGIIIGGFLYVISRGDQARIIKAKNAVMYSLVGLVVVMTAYAITRLIIGFTQ